MFNSSFRLIKSAGTLASSRKKHMEGRLRSPCIAFDINRSRFNSIDDSILLFHHHGHLLVKVSQETSKVTRPHLVEQAGQFIKTLLHPL